MFNPTKDAITFSLTELKRMKDERLVPEVALDALKEKAEGYLKRDTVSVVYRRLKAPSGNPHDYTSMGIYWWPNPDTPNGLPYVRRDGYVNPEVNSDHTVGAVGSIVFNSALAAFYFDDERYAKRAEKALDDWFLNPETYMAPNARYAQAIPGICDGRGVGLIDFATTYNIMDGVRILEAIGMIDPAVVNGVENWFVEFTNWMLTDEIGVEEDNAGNNHGCWFDSQIITSAAFTARPKLLRKIATTAYDRRYKKQIEPDGSMPHELQRTKGIGYTFYAIDALIIIANVAKKAGYNEFTAPDGARGGDILLRKAVDFITPYALDPSTFPYGELHPENMRNRLRGVVYRMAGLFPDSGYGELYRELLTNEKDAQLVPNK